MDLSPLWLQYGAIGLMCAVLIWFAFRSYQREAARGDRYEKEVARLNQVLQDQAKASAEQIASMRDMIEFLKHGHLREEER